MKIAKIETKATIATAIVLLLLGSGAVFAYSTRAQFSSNHFIAPQPLAGDSPTSTSTTSSAHGGNEHEHSSTTQTSTSEAQGHQGNENGQGEDEEHELKFRIVPASSDATGSGEANIQIQGTSLKVDVEIEHAKASTTYSVVLVSLLVSATTSSSSTTTFTTTSTSTTSTVSGGCGPSIGTFVTNDEGNGQAKLETTLSPGNYQIGLVLCSEGAPLAPLLVSDPATTPATITQSTTSESETENQQGENVNEVKANENDEKDIKSATDNKEIPALVQVSGSSASVTQLDPKFSVSVGKTSNNGLIVSISANNVTGSRVLLFNLTAGSYTTDSLKSLVVTFDGNRISQASSLSQILSATPSDPARFIVLVTSAGVQLLVSIPHFSSHVIQILSGLASAGSFLAINAPILIGGILVVTMLSAVLYAKRRRFYSLI